MQPREPPSDDAGDVTQDAWLALQRATDDSRANLVADIVGHPKGAPSVAELEYMNPSLDEGAIRRHLSVLQEADVVEELEVEPGDRVRGFPYKFFSITEEARAIFDRNGLFPGAAWTRQYEHVEKSPEIQEIEEMPRPNE